MDLTLGIDQGSSSSKALLVDEDGAVLWRESIAVSSHIPAPGLCEQDPEELLESVQTLLDSAWQQAGRLEATIGGLAFSTQRSGVCAFKAATGESVSPLLTFRDRRTQSRINLAENDRAFVEEQTGLRCLADYAASKIALLQAEFMKEEFLVGTLDSFLLYNLLDTPSFVIEHTMAARTLLYSLFTNAWDERLCKAFDVNPKRLPQIIPSIPSGLSVRGVPVISILGDGQAALISAMTAGHSAILNMGTISSVSVATGRQYNPHRGCATSLLYYSDHAEYVTEAVTNASGAVISFLNDLLSKRGEKGSLEELDCPGLIPLECAYVPIHGTGSPDWNDGLGIFFSAPINTLSAQELVAVCVYSTGCFIARNILWLQKEGLISAAAAAQALYVTGGLSNSDMLLQFIADVTGMALQRGEPGEGSGYGACQLPAFVKRGVDSKAKSSENKVIEPQASGAPDYYQRWLALEAAILAGKTEELIRIENNE